MREIFIYSGITPNRGRGLHYILEDASSSYADYESALQTAASGFASLSNLTYRLANGVLRVAASAFPDTFITASASYLVEHEIIEGDVINDFKAYFVRSVTLVSGYYVLMLEVDDWATYYGKANISDLRVRRCNRDVGGGVFDLPKNTIGAPAVAFWHAANNRMNLGEVSLLMKIRTIASQNIFGQDVVTTDYMVEMTLQEVYDCFKDGDNWRIVNRDTIIDLAARLCAGVHSAATLSSLVNLDALVNEAWLIPSAQVRRTALPVTIKLKSRTPYTGSNYEIEFDVHKLDVSRTYDYFSTASLSKNYKWFIGTYQNGMPFNFTTTANRRIMCYFDINVDGVSVTLVDGENQKEITSEFILPVLGQSDVADALGKISFYLGMSKDIIGGLSSIFSAKTGADAAIKGVSFGIDYANMLIGSENKTKATGQSGQGNASFNYSVVFSNGWTYLNDRDQQYVYFPLVCVGFLSMDDEEAKAERYGVNFDVTKPSMASILGASFVQGSPAYTYLEADADVAGIPTDAANAIKGKLLAGVRLIEV